jgi:ABC-type multidrug transport system ATPase subunit
VEPVAHFAKTGVSLGGRPVLRGIDLIVAPREVVGISGPNGSGKTTLIRTAATLTTPDQGSVTILGQDTRDRGLGATRRSIGMIGHSPGLIGELTLGENLDHVARLAGIERVRVGRALEVVGLGEVAGRRADTSSYGMRRRVDIARLLLTKPRLLLLDEAASGLDEAARQLINALVDSVCERDGACIVVSHDRAHLEGLCTRVASLTGGSLDGAPS